MVMCTTQGIIKKTPLKAYVNPRTKGIQAIKINKRDNLLEVKLTQGNDHLIMALRSGNAVHFHERDVRAMGRVAAGVKGVTLAHSDDQVVGMVAIQHPQTDLLVVSEKGFGKRSAATAYRITKRGAKGVKTLNITTKTGPLIAIKEVTNTDELLIINKAGIAIRIAVATLRTIGRNTQGVRLIRLSEGDIVTSVAKIEENIETEEK